MILLKWNLFSGEYIIIILKYVCREPLLVDVRGVFILRRDVLLYHVQLQYLLFWAVT